jgi:predicted DNA-binding protein
MSPKKGQRLVAEEDKRRNQLAVRLTDAELEALEKLSKRKGYPISFYIREGIAAVIERYSKGK